MAELLGSLLMRQLHPPKDAPVVPPMKQKDPPPLAAQPKAPGNIPGEKDISQAATVKDEKRRILRALPTPTQKEYVGDLPGADAVVKKRILGGGTGRTTTGA